MAYRFRGPLAPPVQNLDAQFKGSFIVACLSFSYRCPWTGDYKEPTFQFPVLEGWRLEDARELGHD